MSYRANSWQPPGGPFYGLPPSGQQFQADPYQQNFQPHTNAAYDPGIGQQLYSHQDHESGWCLPPSTPPLLPGHFPPPYDTSHLPPTNPCTQGVPPCATAPFPYSGGQPPPPYQRGPPDSCYPQHLPNQPVQRTSSYGFQPSLSNFSPEKSGGEFTPQRNLPAPSAPPECPPPYEESVNNIYGPLPHQSHVPDSPGPNYIAEKRESVYPSVPSYSDFNGSASSRVSSAFSQETPLWKSGEGVQVFFVQREGYVVSPRRVLSLAVYRCSDSEGLHSSGKENSPVNLPKLSIEVPGVWKLKLYPQKTAFLLAESGDFVFLDNSTGPSMLSRQHSDPSYLLRHARSGRFVVILLPSTVIREQKFSLEELLRSSALFYKEETTAVDKVNSSIGSAYTSVTTHMSDLMKDMTPGVHKSTKWLRRGTGSILRMGGNAISKGVNLVADQVWTKDKEHNEVMKDGLYSDLMLALQLQRKAVASSTVTCVTQF